MSIWWNVLSKARGTRDTGKRVICNRCGNRRLSSSAVAENKTQCATCNRKFGSIRSGGRPRIKKNLNVEIARRALEGPAVNNPDENYDLCCEHSREAMENQLREFGEIGAGVLASPEWRNYNCENLRTELELWSAMDMPGMQQIVEAWDKCAELGGADELV